MDIIHPARESIIQPARQQLAGPIVSPLVGALEGTALVGGLSALGAGLASIGIPKGSIIRYESAIKAGKFRALVHGSDDEMSGAKAALDKATPAELALHTS